MPIYVFVDSEQKAELKAKIKPCRYICRYFFPSLRYFNFSKDVFEPKFQKMTKTVNLNVRVQRISSTCEAHIL